MLYKIPFKTIDTILFCSSFWDFPPILPLFLCLKDSRNNLLYNVAPDIHSPIEPSDSIIYNTFAQVASGF